MKAKILARSVVLMVLLFFIQLGMTFYGFISNMKIGLAEAQNRWLILLYDDGDFNNGFDALFSFAAEAYAHENLEALVLEDNFWSPAMIWQIGRNHELIPQKYLGEVDMGNSATLEYFLKFAHSRFPGRRTILCFYNHGAGCWGACIDENTYDKNPQSPTILSLAEMRSALEKTRSVDLICFTAPCLMGSIEAAYELRHNTEAFLDSENLSGYIIWMGSIRLLCDTLKSRPNIDNYELAQAIVRSTAACYQQYDPVGFDRNYTLAAVRSDRLEAAAQAISELSATVLANRNEAFALFNQVLGDIRFYSYYYADVIDLFEETMKRCQNPTLRESFQRAIDAVREAVLAEVHGAELVGSNGLNIYFPPPPNVMFSPYYATYGIAFAQDAGWFELLKAYRESWPSAVQPDGRIPILLGNGLDIPLCNGVKSILYRWINLERKGRINQ